MPLSSAVISFSIFVSFFSFSTIGSFFKVSDVDISAFCVFSAFSELSFAVAGVRISSNFSCTAAFTSTTFSSLDAFDSVFFPAVVCCLLIPASFFLSFFSFEATGTFAVGLFNCSRSIFPRVLIFGSSCFVTVSFFGSNAFFVRTLSFCFFWKILAASFFTT